MAKLGARFGTTRLEADEVFQAALDAYQKRNLEKAILNVNAALELLPNKIEYVAARGLFYLQDGLYENAAADFDTVLKRNRYHLIANYGRGMMAYRDEDYEAARDYFMRAWAADEERPETMYYLALTEHRLLDNVKALAWMREAYRIFDASGGRQNKRNARDAQKWVEELEKLVDLAERFGQ